MAIPFSQNIRSESAMVSKLRPVMPVAIFMAAIEGNSNILIPRLGLLQPEEPTEIQETIEASHSAPEQTMTEQQTIQSDLQSATGFGDTILHLLVTNRHNELALKVFQSDKSLLKARNKMSETPIHSASKVGNDEVIQKFIQIDEAVMKNALEETNENGDTALHVAVRYGYIDISVRLMEFDPKIAYKVNKEMLSPMYIAIEREHNFITEKMVGVHRKFIDPDRGYNFIAENMLEVDHILACTQFTCGMFPAHLAARKGNWRLVFHFIANYPDYAKLVDPHGRNIFHIAAEEGNRYIFYTIRGIEDMQARMNIAKDYEGNTPLHIAAMKGHRHTMRVIWKNRINQDAETVQNKRGLTPYQVFRRQFITESNEAYRIAIRIQSYEKINGEKFSEEWFHNVMDLSSVENKWERTQVIGLGSVLITTVAFAVAFTIPGGYNQDNGTPILGRKYMFWAFILANSLSFILGFLSLFALLMNAVPNVPVDTLLFATIIFLFAASSMVVAFGTGLYVMLAPICSPIAIILLIITLFIGSPALYIVIAIPGEKYFGIVTNFLFRATSVVAISVVFFVFIFCLALLSL